MADHPLDSFKERDLQELDEYLAAELAGGMSRQKVIDTMRGLTVFTDSAVYQWENTEYALIYGTIARSARTFSSTCLLLEHGMAVQAAVLARTLFEDMVVAHWIALNLTRDDAAWLGQRFIRHRSAISRLQERLRQETKFGMGPPIPRAEQFAGTNGVPPNEFGPNAALDWWSKPADNGHPGLKMKEIVIELEKAAADHESFHPRFAGGKESVLVRLDKVVYKWFSQCIHHTAIGLPFSPVDEFRSEVPPDQMLMVGFASTWVFAQQVFLLHELNAENQQELDVTWHKSLAQFVEIFQGRKEADRLIAEFLDFHGLDEFPN